MLADSKLRFEPKVLVSYQSPEGPRLVGAKGALLRGRIEALRQAGYYEEYVRHLAPEQRDAVLQALPASWLPAEAFNAHYAALDRLSLTDTQLTRMVEALGANLYQTMFSALLKLTRSSSADGGPWPGFRQADRVYQRLYRGGGVIITQVGPKDALHEQLGIPWADSRSFRAGHAQFVRGVVNLTARTCVVREVPSRTPRTERLTLSLSWV